MPGTKRPPRGSTSQRYKHHCAPHTPLPPHADSHRLQRHHQKVPCSTNHFLRLRVPLCRPLCSKTVFGIKNGHTRVSTTP